MIRLSVDLLLLAFSVAGLGAPRLLWRYGRLVVLNRGMEQRKIKRLIAPCGHEEKSEVWAGRGLPNGDVIVPIYDNHDDVLALLNELERADDFSGRVILVNDASRDQRIAPLLDEFKNRRADVSILHNEHNLGFVGTCNRGFAQSGEDVIVLNTDIILPQGAIGRLFEVLQSDPDTATVTPVSSNAYGFGFPYPIQRNQRPFGTSVAEVDRCFQDYSYLPAFEVPTGIGFCMAMKRRVMDEIGVFDDYYGKGYGEELDFCLRARAAGYANRGAPHVYVYHKGGESFGDWQNKARLGSLRVLNRHPSYPQLVGDYFDRGDMRALGFSALCALCAGRTGQPIKLVHNDPDELARRLKEEPQRPLMHLVDRRAYIAATLHNAGERYEFRLAAGVSISDLAAIE